MVMLVSGDEETARSLRSSLNFQGYDVAVARTSDEAWRTLLGEMTVPDAVLVDNVSVAEVALPGAVCPRPNLPEPHSPEET